MHHIHAELMATQQQEGFRNTPEGEQAKRHKIGAGLRAQAPPAQRCEWRQTGCMTRRFADAEHDQQDCEQPRDRGEGNDQIETLRPPIHHGRGGQRAEHCAGMIECARQPIGACRHAFRNNVGEHGVAWRAAQSLSDAVGDADAEYHGPATREADQWTYQVGEGVTEQHKWLAPAPGHIRTSSGPEFEQVGGGVGEPLDETEHHRTGAQYSDEQERNERCHHLAGKIVEQADETDDDHCPRQAACRRIGGNGVAVHVRIHNGSWLA